MSRVLVLVGFIVVGALALFAVEIVGPAGSPDSHPVAGPSSSDTVTLRSDTGPGQAFWLRLRWLLAGAGFAAVALVGLRQYRLFAHYQLGLYEPARFARPRRGDQARPETTSSAPAFTLDWMVERAPTSAGD